jgi:hypothetical protein
MGWKNWFMHSHTENVFETGQILGKKLIYLSPDAELPLEKVESGIF